MPDLTARFTDILRKHQHRIDLNGDPDQQMFCECQHMCSGPDGWMLQMEPAEHPAHVAELITAAAEQHYRPRIETVEQLDALPEDSVVRDDSRYVYEKATARRWYQPGWEGQRWSDAIDLPATVLWSPGGER